MLVRADALRKAGGIEVIRDALIDDCALAQGAQGARPDLARPDRARAQHPRLIPAFADIRRMVARSAYAQLRYSPLLLAGTVAGMALTYLAPPLLAMFGSGTARVDRPASTWVLMAVAFQPTLRFYRLSPLWGLALPAIALQYHALHPRFRLSICARTRRQLEGARASQRVGDAMIDDRCRSAIGQGPPGREFSGRLAAHSSAPSRADPGVLRVRAHRRRHRRSSVAAAAGEARAARPAGSDACSGSDDDDPVGVALRAQLAERAAVAAPRAGPAHRVPHGRDQAALRRLGRPDRLLPLFGHAGRPLRARRARREPRDLAGQRRAVRGAADHQSSAGLRQGLSRSRPGLYSARRLCRRRRDASKRSAPSAPRRRCWPASTSSRGAPAICCATAGRSPPRSRTRGSPWRSRSSRRLPSAWSRLLQRARSAERARASRQGGGRGLRPPRPDTGRKPPRRPRLRGRHKPQDA